MTEIDLSRMSDTEKQNLLMEFRKLDERKRYNQLAYYEARPWQVPFHTSLRRFRMYMAPNRVGKTYAGAMEMAMHLTGRYPPNWKGHRFPGPIDAWVIGTSYEQMRDSCQRLLFGIELGTGAIPKDAIINVESRPGAPGSYAIAYIRHASGGISTLALKAYNQGRNALQGTALDLAWMDEEPLLSEQEAGVVDEIVTRLRDRKGHLIITYTPLGGETPLTKEYYPVANAPELRELIHVDMADYPGLAKDIEEVKKLYPRPHEWRARIHGLPALGEGAVFPYTEDQFTCRPISLSENARFIMGMDWAAAGSGHPSTMVLAGWEQFNDTVYIMAEFSESGVMPAIPASWSKRLMPGVRHAWPQDLLQHDSSGKTRADYYRAEGLQMCPEHAQYPDERRNSLEGSIDDINLRIMSGRFKVFTTCVKLIREMGKYHRKSHKVVPIDDDLISAARYAIMMLRFSLTAGEYGSIEGARRRNEPQGEPDVGWDWSMAGG